MDEHATTPTSVLTLGGGSPAAANGAAPFGAGIDTPPDPLYQGGGQIKGASVEIECQTEVECYTFTFSAKTCIELLPTLTPAQLDHEIKFFGLMGCSFDLRGRKPSDTAKQSSMQKVLTNNICNDLQNVFIKYDAVIRHLSYLLEIAQQHIDDMRAVNTTPVSRPLTTPAHTATSIVSDYNPLDPVCFLNLDFSDIPINTVLTELNINEQGPRGRKTAYFGDIEYTYDKYTHSPADYPDCDLFKYIFHKMPTIVPDFNPTNYTCLINFYPDGESIIPPHSDNEASIIPDSVIYCISLGAPRTLKLSNTINNSIQTHTLPNGSVYAMSAQSQSTWKHSIERDPSITQPRLSLTFRRLRRVDSVPKHIIPPIAPPKTPQPAVNSPQPRILLLTDSLLSNTPLFDNVKDFKSTKKINYKLCDIFNFEAEFEHSDFVIISCGINDLSRYNFTAHTLADVIYKRLKTCCMKNNNTVFIFNSLLLTQFNWLNAEVAEFNRIMFNLSRSQPNMWFLDTHSALMNSSLRHALDPRGNGIHLTLDAKNLASRELVIGVAHFVYHHSSKRVAGFRPRNWQWPLREAYAHTPQRHVIKRTH